MSNKISRRTMMSATLPAAILGVGITATAKAADQPHMQEALDHLKRAQQELSQATADKGGHRVKAERLIRQAMAEVERGIQFDRRH
jgi:hypothetical protein